MNAPATFYAIPVRPFVNPDDLVDTGAMIVALRAQYPCLRDVPTITARCVEPDARLVELLAKDAPLTAAEWAELTAIERSAS